MHQDQYYLVFSFTFIFNGVANFVAITIFQNFTSELIILWIDDVNCYPFAANKNKYYFKMLKRSRIKFFFHAVEFGEKKVCLILEDEIAFELNFENIRRKID